jgi:thiol-disulfide isomerase/thioredoxin
MIYNLTNLNKKDINKILIEKNNVVVLYHSNTCEYCIDLMPLWKRVTNKYVKDNNVIIINAEANCIKYLRVKFKKNIIGYPTIMKYSKGKMISEYDGEKKARELNNFLKK